MFKIGLSTTGKDICEDLFKNYNQAGIAAMEISTASEKYPLLNYKEIYDLSKKYNIKLWSFHLPFRPFDEVDLSRNDLRNSTVSYFSELIKRAGDTGIDKFVVHSSGIGLDDSNRKERISIAKESLAALAEVAKQNGGAIAVENLPAICLGKDSNEVLELISSSDDLKVCFDTNHLPDESPMEFIRKLGEKIITVHVSDYDFIKERHWLPGEGKVNWQEILSALNEINYNGVWMYEVGFNPPVTITRSRPLNCEDFVRNAKEIFENKEPTVLGIPNL